MTFQYADDLYCLFDTCPDVLSSHMEEYRVSGEIIDDDPNHYASPESLQGSCAGKMSPMDHSDKLFNTSGPVFIKLEINENADRIVSVKSDEASVDLSPKVYAESCANYTSDSSVDSSVGSSVKSTDTSDTSVTHLSPVGGVGLGDVIIKIQRPFDTFGAKTSFDVTAWDRTIKVRFNSWEQFMRVVIPSRYCEALVEKPALAQTTGNAKWYILRRVTSVCIGIIYCYNFVDYRP